MKVTVIATGFDVAERMASMEHGARIQMPSNAPMTVPSQQMPQHMPQQMRDSQQMRNAQPVFTSPHVQREFPTQMPRTMEQAPAFSNRRVQQAAPVSREAAAQDPRVSPQSGRIAVRERSSNFPAFDTDWDVPAFQRKGQ